MKDILIPTDFSSVSRRALDMGVSIFEHSDEGANFILIATFPFPAGGGHSWIEIHDSWKKAVAKGFAEEIELARQNYSLKNISFETLSFIGSLENVLAHLVRERSIDCVVFGTPQDSRSEELVVKILSRVTCPVLLVPRPS